MEHICNHCSFSAKATAATVAIFTQNTSFSALGEITQLSNHNMSVQVTCPLHESTMNVRKHNMENSAVHYMLQKVLQQIKHCTKGP